jgi:outer membrane receptor for ferrienterochelin and colicins
MNYIKIIGPLILMMFSFIAPAQFVAGTVYENPPGGTRSPLAGVNVYWIHTTNGTFTDAKGDFRISTAGIKDKRLIVSLLGYRKDTVAINPDNIKVEIKLGPEEENLKEVEIRDRQGSFLSKLNPRQTQVINIGELQRAACCNLAESFETNASVDVSYADAVSGAKQIQLLGLSGIYSQVMTENVPLIRGLASVYGLNYIPGPWMESIQVSKGTASVVNGYESVTGQINVEYKKPENAEKFYLNLFANSNLRFEVNTDGSIKLNDKLSTLLAAHVDEFWNKFDRNDDGFMDLPKLQTYNFFNRWDYINPGKMVSKFGVQYLDETRDGGQMAFDKSAMNYDTAGISNGTKTFGIGIRTKRLSAFWKNGFFIKDHPASSFGLILTGINHDQTGFYGINQYTGHERMLYANLIFNTTINGDMHKIAAGLSYMLDDYREAYNQVTPVYDLNSNDIFRLMDTIHNFINQNRTEWVTGAFFEYTLNLKKFTLIAGIRGDYDNLWNFFVTPRLHLRYRFNETTILRGTVGMGYRTADVLAENSPAFVSQRSFIIKEKPEQEKAWNFGLNFTKEFTLFKRKAEVNLDAYRTSFINQVVADEDSDPTKLYISNLHGKSYANNFQVQLTAEPVKRLNVTLAFRVNDVKQTIADTLRRKPMVSQYKGLATVSYATKFNKWTFDLTGQLNGPARIPNADNMPSALARPGSSPVWFQLLAQITKKFKFVDVYIGGENLTNYTQKDLITEYWRPYHSHFDGSMVWGPVTGITIYGGLRWVIK